jgi:nitrite reductase (NADH) large subunit
MHIVIIGCGVSGITAAITVRKNSPEAKISVYTDENYPYYPRPDLYGVLSGEKEPQEIYAFSDEWYEKEHIKVHLNKKVVGIDTAREELLLEDRSHRNYDKLLLANGAHPFIPPVKGIEKVGVFTLRSMEDALTIRKHVRKTRKTIIIGGGLLGLEFAASLRKLGQQVEVVEIFPRLLPMQLDHDGATVLKGRIEALGINITLGVKTQEILGKEKVSGISLDNGKEVSGNLVLFSAGIRSNTSLAADAGIKVNKGVVVNEYLQTNANDIYAVGDVAEFEGRIYGSIPAAEEQARIAAVNIVKGERSVYKGTIPSNTLKIVGIDLASRGLVNAEGPRYEEIKKIDRTIGVYKKIVLDQGKIVGAIILGDMKSAAPLKALMDRGIDISKSKDSILEEGFDYRKLFSKS